MLSLSVILLGLLLPDNCGISAVRSRLSLSAAAWCARNGVALDSLTTLRDLGRSAFTGAHRENPDRNALAAFLRLVEGGKVPRGSYLVIENLDRLTREHIRPALTLLLSLLDNSLTMENLDGLPKGPCRDNPDHLALAYFRTLVKKREVKDGDYLIIENLDRLSREHMQEALIIVLDLIRDGINVVQLSPVEYVHSMATHVLYLGLMMQELSRNSSEDAALAKQAAARAAGEEIDELVGFARERIEIEKRIRAIAEEVVTGGYCRTLVRAANVLTTRLDEVQAKMDHIRGLRDRDAEDRSFNTAFRRN